MIKHGYILVLTDFSGCDAEALRRAYVLAENHYARSQVLHVLEPDLPRFSANPEWLR